VFIFGKRKYVAKGNRAKFFPKIMKIPKSRSDGPNTDEIELTETGALIHGGNTESTMVNPNPDGSSSGQGIHQLFFLLFNLIQVKQNSSCPRSPARSASARSSAKVKISVFGTVF
jgi:hypothetical protein